MAALQNYLKDEIDRRGWSIEEFAKRSGISLSNAYLIVRDGKDNVRQDTLASIAGAFNMSSAELLWAAHPRPDDPVWQTITSMIPEMREAVRDTPRPLWGTIIKSQFRRAVEGTRDMAQLLADQLAAPVSGLEPGGVNAPKGTPKRGHQGEKGPLTNPSPRLVSVPSF